MKNKSSPGSRLAALFALGLALILANDASADEAEASQPTDATTPDDAQVAQGSEEEPAVTDEVPAVEEPAEAEAPSAAAETGDSDPAEVQTINIDATNPNTGVERRFWNVLGIYELHFNPITDDYGASDWYQWFMARGDLNITDFDQVSLRMDATYRFIADPDETGFFFGDMRFYYGRRFSIPFGDYTVGAKAQVYLTAPTSRSSQAQGIITAPTAILTLVPQYGDFTFFASGYYRYYFAKYAESAHGGVMNPQMTTGFWLQVFWSPLDWFAPSATWMTLWTLPYRSREGERQPWQPNYYFEFALNFSLPMPERGPAMDVSLAYGQGANVYAGGVSQFYFAQRDQSDLYLNLSITY